MKQSLFYHYPDKKIKKAAFPFHLRVPEWCKKPIVNLNGQTIETDVTGERMIILNREWQQNDKITIEFPATISISHWFDGGAVVERGPLVYALKLNEKWEKKHSTHLKIKNSMENGITRLLPIRLGILLSNTTKYTRMVLKRISSSRKKRTLQLIHGRQQMLP